MSENAKWYVIHTYSGYENAVKTSIEKFVNGRGMEDMILRMEIPVETVKEVSESGEAKEVERKVFPGYVLIKMVMTDDTWHLVRNVRGVTGFVGTANKPIPLTEEEVLAMGMEKHEIVVGYNVGDHVRIVDGPLASFTGVVEDIEPEKNQVSVMVSMFGRETPVELELDQVEPMDRKVPAASNGHFSLRHRAAERGRDGSVRPAKWARNAQHNHIFIMEVLFRGTESNWIRKTADPRR